MDVARFERFIDAQVSNGGLSDGTARKYKSAVASLTDWVGDVEELTVEDMKDYLLAKATEDGSDGSTLNVYKCAFGKYLAAVSRAAEYTELRMWFRNNFSATSGGTPDYLDDDEADAVREAAAGDPRDEAMVALFLRTGLRVGELVSLDRDDIDRSAGDHDGGSVRIQRQKRRKDITHERKLTQADLDAIDRYLDNLGEYAPQRAQSEDALFVNTQPNDGGSHRVTESYIRSQVTALGDRADHPDVTGDRLHPHLFRHTVGTRLGKQGYNAQEIGSFLGKGTGAERYVHFDAEQFNEMSDAVA